MANIYEVDPNADALIILSGPSPKAADSHKPTAKPNKPNGVANGVTNGHTSHELLRLKVSSKHLSLASRHFRSLHGRAGDSHLPVESDGRVHFQLEGYDRTAVTLVMDIVHSRGSRVPKTLDLDTLTQVALFVDAYKFQEAVEAYTDRWITGLSKTVPKKFSEQLVQWIYVAQALQNAELFKRVTKIAITQTTDAIEPSGKLPIPDAVIKHIDARRQELIAQVVSFLHDLVAELEQGDTPCTNGCDTFLLGVLVKALHRWKLAKPYHGISFEAVATAVRDIQDEVWYTGPHPAVTLGGEEKEREAPRTKQNRSGIHHCGVRSLINPKLYEMGVSLEGLTLKI